MPEVLATPIAGGRRNWKPPFVHSPYSVLTTALSLVISIAFISVYKRSLFRYRVVLQYVRPLVMVNVAEVFIVSHAQSVVLYCSALYGAALCCAVMWLPPSAYRCSSR